MARFPAALLILASACSLAESPLKVVAQIPRRGRIEKPLVADADRDGLGELLYIWSWWGRRLEMVEYRPVNRYELEWSYTGVWPTESIVLGNFWPYDIGDVDRDGKVDMVGYAPYDSGAGYRYALCTFESRDSWSYPDTLSWYATTPMLSCVPPVRYASLDRDSAGEILAPWIRQACSTGIFENVGDNRESLICIVPGACGQSSWTVDDYDRNGCMDYSFKWGWYTYAGECIGDNSYALVCSVYTGTDNVQDRFDGHDIDHNGRPEFFEVNEETRVDRTRLELWQFEATAEHQYTCELVDTSSCNWDFYAGLSLCTDIDADGIEEIVWGCGERVLVLGCGPGSPRYQRRYVGSNAPNSRARCNAADFNGNGYKEIFVGGDSTGISVFEVEAVWLWYPQWVAHLHGGDTCVICWRVYQPPRCDSVSLFLRTDTTLHPGERFWRLDTIVTGLAPTESSYRWVVPETTLSWAKVLAIAYGPGWQYDESDTPFGILPHGVNETAVAAAWELPVPTVWRGAIWLPMPRHGQAVPSMTLCDALGRRVATLHPGVNDLRRLAPGVYFVRMADGEGRMVNAKVVITR